MSDKKSEIKYKFIFPDNFSPMFSNCMWGAISPKGQFNLYFCQDRMPLPKATFHELKDNGQILGEVRRDLEDKLVIRDVVSGIILNYTDAKEIHALLGNLIKEFEVQSGLMSSKEKDDG